MEAELGEKEQEKICMSMLDNIYEIKSMEKALLNGQVEINTSDNIIMMNEKVKERWLGLTVQSTKEIGLGVSSMVMERWQWVMDQ